MVCMYSNCHFPARWGHLSRQRRQPAQSQQVIRGTYQVGVQLHPCASDKRRLAKSPAALHPAEDLFDTLAFLLTNLVARMARGAPIQPWSIAALDHRDVRGDAALAQIAHEAFA